MTADDHPKFKNDQGLPEIRIGTKNFKCAGTSAPHDHPHVYLEMGAADEILCPYCATLFRHDPSLGPREAELPDCVFLDSPEA